MLIISFLTLQSSNQGDDCRQFIGTHAKLLAKLTHPGHYHSSYKSRTATALALDESSLSSGHEDSRAILTVLQWMHSGLWLILNLNNRLEKISDCHEFKAHLIDSVIKRETKIEKLDRWEAIMLLVIKVYINLLLTIKHLLFSALFRVSSTRKIKLNFILTQSILSGYFLTPPKCGFRFLYCVFK